MKNKIVEYKGKKYKYVEEGYCEDCSFYIECRYKLDEIVGVDRGTCVEEFGKDGHFEELTQITNIKALDRFRYNVSITNEELLRLEIFASENAIYDHFQIKEEMVRRGMEIVERNNWGSNRVGAFCNSEGEK